jgi:hypothetical protein
MHAVFPARVRHGIWLAGSSAKRWLVAWRAGKAKSRALGAGSMWGS